MMHGRSPRTPPSSPPRAAAWRFASAALLIVATIAIATIAGVACDDGSVDETLAGSRPAPATSSAGGGSGGGGSSGSGSGGNGAGGSGSGSSSGSGGGASSGRGSSGGSVGSDGGEVSGDGGGGSAQGRALFEALAPTLESTCGGPCHQQGAGGAPLWLGPPDPYESAVKYPGIVVANPQSSVVVTKGRHEGPALQDPLLSQVLQWLTVEAAALPPTALPQTAPFTVTMGSNDIDCSAAGVPGLHVLFTATATSNLLTLENLSIETPATTAVQITYPIFALLPPGAAEIDDASLSAVSQTVPPGTTTALGPGILVLTQWATGDKMKIEFTSIVKAMGTDGGSLTGGCKALSSFVQNAVPAIQANTCLNCHDTGGSGNASLDLSGLAANPPDDATACAQALSQANPQDPAQSEIILAPTGQVANHPFKNASQSFVQMMQTWIAAEK